MFFSTASILDHKVKKTASNEKIHKKYQNLHFHPENGSSYLSNLNARTHTRMDARIQVGRQEKTG